MQGMQGVKATKSLSLPAQTSILKSTSQTGEPQRECRDIGNQQQGDQRNQEERHTSLKSAAHAGSAQLCAHQQRNTYGRRDAADVDVNTGQDAELDQVDTEGIYQVQHQRYHHYDDTVTLHQAAQNQENNVNHQQNHKLGRYQGGHCLHKQLRQLRGNDHIGGSLGKAHQNHDGSYGNRGLIEGVEQILDADRFVDKNTYNRGIEGRNGRLFSDDCRVKKKI
jgi:glycine dehydrogenase